MRFKVVLRIISATLLVYSVFGTKEINQKTNKYIEYHCGSVVITNINFDEAIHVAISELELGSIFPVTYTGQLYSEGSGYRLWPIKPNDRVFKQGIDFPGPHFIVLNKMMEVVDVIVRMSDYNFIKCQRYDDLSLNGPQDLVVENSNGYQCAHEFFSDQNIEKSQQLAISKLNEVGLPYPRLVNDDPLYKNKNDNRRYMIWPIIKSGHTYTTGSETGGPFYIVIDQMGKLIDIVVKLSDNCLMKCLRDRKIEPASPNDPLSQLFVPPPIPGVHCGKVFFDDKYMNLAAEMAKISASSQTKSKTRYPKTYTDESFSKEKLLLWPLSVNHKNYVKGGPGIYRVVLSENFKVLGAIVTQYGRIHRCEKGMIKGKKNHDTNDFECHGTIFSHQELYLAAQIACKMRNSATRRYPAIYEGPSFDIGGPYLTYPIIKGRRFTKNPGSFRIVINTKCEIAGAIVKVGESFFKCWKKTDILSTSLSRNEPGPQIRERFSH